MKKILLFFSILLIAASCTKNSANVQLTITDAKDSTGVIVTLLDINRLQLIDTLQLKADGKFSYEVELPEDTPSFYYFFSEGKKIASAILQPGDKVSITTNLADGLYEISGSEESDLLWKIEREFGDASDQYRQLLARLDETNENDSETLKEIQAEMSQLYIEYKRTAMKHIMSNLNSITAVSTLFQEFSQELPIFAQANDVFLFKTVYDSVSVVYPDSKLVAALNNQIIQRYNVSELQKMVNNAGELAFPEITMPDINGQEQKLSSLNGKVIVLYFWSEAAEDQKMFNIELKEIYEKYHSKGLEVYQVSLDIDKSSWATTVRTQELPWICVNDGLGIESQSLSAYNVQTIPALYLIARDGSIPVVDVFNPAELEKQIRKLL